MWRPLRTSRPNMLNHCMLLYCPLIPSLCPTPQDLLLMTCRSLLSQPWAVNTTAYTTPCWLGPSLGPDMHLLHIGLFDLLSYVPLSFLSSQNSWSPSFCFPFSTLATSHQTLPPCLWPCTHHCISGYNSLTALILGTKHLRHCMSLSLARPTSHLFTSHLPSLHSIHILKPSYLALAKQAMIGHSFSFSLVCCQHLKPLFYAPLQLSPCILGCLGTRPPSPCCAFNFLQDHKFTSGGKPQRCTGGAIRHLPDSCPWSSLRPIHTWGLMSNVDQTEPTLYIIWPMFISLENSLSHAKQCGPMLTKI